MKNIKSKAFTLVELLVVITILSIISVVAYQNFGGAIDKAVSSRKISDVSTIEVSLQQYKVDKKSYPATDVYDGQNNLWGYNSKATSTPSNKITVAYNGEEIREIILIETKGGGKIVGIGSFIDRQIGAKGTISRSTLGKKYLSKDLYDPELGDVKVVGTGSSNKMIDYGIGRYVYATYKKNKSNSDWGSNLKGVNYNLAFTIKKQGSDKYITKIVGDYDEESCFDDSAKCPTNLIGLAEGSEEDGESNQDYYGVPYTVTDFFAQ